MYMISEVCTDMAEYGKVDDLERKVSTTEGAFGERQPGLEIPDLALSLKRMMESEGFVQQHIVNCGAGLFSANKVDSETWYETSLILGYVTFGFKKSS